MDTIPDGVQFLLHFSEESLPEGSTVTDDSYKFELILKQCPVRRTNSPEGMLHVYVSEILLNKLSLSITEAEARSAQLFSFYETVVGESNRDEMRDFVTRFTSRFPLGTAMLGVIEIIRVDVCTYWFNGQSGKVDKKMEVVKYKAASVGGDQRTSCSVCLDEFEEDVCVVKTGCCHYFHEKCIGAWLTRKATCPLCRRNIS